MEWKYMNCGYATFAALLGLAGLLPLGCGSDGSGAPPDGAAPTRFSAATKSSPIVVSQDGRYVLVANVDTGTATLVEVRDSGGSDVQRIVGEVKVGEEPRFVAMTPDGRKGYVSNSLGDVSVLDLSMKGRIRVAKIIPLEGELRGLALTPNGKQLYVANYSEGVVHRINAVNDTLVDDVPVGGHPYALAISTDHDDDDMDETVFVSEFFSEPISPGEGFDTGRQGVVYSFSTSGGGPDKHTLAPLDDSGFVADRTAFVGTVFAAPAGTPDITKTPQGCHPNQLHSLLLRGDRVWVTSIAAAPAPPVIFNNNIQALVNVLDTGTKTEVDGERINLNALVKVETQPDPATGSSDRLFMGDLVDLAANDKGTVFLAVSRSGNFVVRAQRDAAGRLTFNNSASTPAIRLQTGWLPTGAMINAAGDRAYVYNEAGYSITAIDLNDNAVIEKNIPTTTIPSPGTFHHDVLWGKIAFFTSLGTPNDGLRDLEIRDVDPLSFRDGPTGKGPASDNGWSSCGSCHPSGRSDNVTWMFANGPRQTIPLDATFSKTNPLDRRVENWSAVRSSVTEFNNNSRGVQGGLGFVEDFASIYNHGFTEGVSEALDDLTLWVQTVRTLTAKRSAAPVSRAVFDTYCASCHGGSKWSKSTVLWDDNPTFPSNPAIAAVPPFDPGLLVALDSVALEPRDSLESYQGDTNGDGILDGSDAVLRILDGVGTFDPASPIEIRGAGGQAGKIANGAAGFNAPSLLGLGYTAPYLHDGSAGTLADVFAKHALGAGTIATTLSSAEQDELTGLLLSIDGTTVPVDSEADTFRDQLGP